MSAQLETVNSVPEHDGGIAGFGVWILKCAAMWIAALASAVAAAKLVPVPFPQAPSDGPLTIGQAFLAVNGLTAVAVSLLAERARVRGFKLAFFVFVAFYGASSAMMTIETFYFNASIRMTSAQIWGLAAQAAIAAAVIAAVAAVLFRPQTEEPSGVPYGMMARVLALTVLYVVLYYTAGFFIAWESAAVRAYYENGIHFSLLPTIALQVARGFLWALLALFIATRLRGSVFSRAAVMAVMFAVFTDAQLLYPNPFVPWAVRQMHVIEVGSSEAAYGFLAAIMLLAGRRSPDNGWRWIAG